MTRNEQTEDRHDAAIRRVHVAEFFAPDVLRGGLEEQHQAERRNHRIQVRRVAQRPEHHPLERHAKKRHADHGGNQRHPVRQSGARCRICQVGAEHEQLAMREVRHLHGAVDQRQPKCHEAIDAAGNEAVEHLLRE
jgi:hypothetical protein